jgi:tetratricopeptide (TPR) repeat protein
MKIGIFYYHLNHSKGGKVMICRNCGSEIPDTAKFCPKCGAKVEIAKAYEVTPKKGSSLKWIWIVLLVLLIVAIGVGGTYFYFSRKKVQAPTEIAKETSQPPAVTPSKEVKEHIKDGLAYVSNAKNARSKEIFEENLENAIREFSLAIEKNPNYAEAYSNRAVAYMLQKKFNKAEEDLLKAKQLNPDSPTIRYNFVCLYSLTGKLDLALDELDAALEKGFNDYEALRKDPDLNNLRKHPEFRKILEKHRVFIMK